jgi:hypothetical protein
MAPQEIQRTLSICNCSQLPPYQEKRVQFRSVTGYLGSGRGEACTGFWWVNLRERDQWGDLGVDGTITLKWILRKWDLGVWTELSWLGRETGGGHL